MRPALVALACAALAPSAVANDGADRTGHQPQGALTSFAASLSRDAGLWAPPDPTTSPASFDPAFRWVRPHVRAAVEVAAYRTARAFGPAEHDMELRDMSAENGDSPVELGDVHGEEGAWHAPRGRHPGDTHDGGVRVDLTLYQTAPPDGRSGAQIDVVRQAFFFLQLLKLHRFRFGLALLEHVQLADTVDEQIRRQLLEWLYGRRFGVSGILLQDWDELTVPAGRGERCQLDPWAVHLSFADLHAAGSMHQALERLQEEHELLQARLLGRQHPGWPAALSAQLASTDLVRSIEVAVLPIPGRDERIASVRYRLAGGEWTSPAQLRRQYRASLPLPPGPRAALSHVVVEAEIATHRRTVVVETEVVLPAQDPRLRVGYREGMIRGSAALSADEITLRLRFPAVLRALITGARFTLYPSDLQSSQSHVVPVPWLADAPAPSTQPSTLEARGEAELELHLARGQAPASLGYVEAEVELCQQRRVRVPLDLPR